ncbi:hypothetical protein J6590_063580 [Homalodisca vitripennis]|nr:hypothetical protein J6590_063580 [Homalodisca vitripennis]
MDGCALNGYHTIKYSTFYSRMCSQWISPTEIGDLLERNVHSTDIIRKNWRLASAGRALN